MCVPSGSTSDASSCVRGCMQGYQVSDDEINMDLTTFRSHYASQTGIVECVLYQTSS